MTTGITLLSSNIHCNVSKLKAKSLEREILFNDHSNSVSRAPLSKQFCCKWECTLFLLSLHSFWTIVKFQPLSLTTRKFHSKQLYNQSFHCNSWKTRILNFWTFIVLLHPHFYSQESPREVRFSSISRVRLFFKEVP